ncbi:MAG: FAD-dependent oxidoreductase [Mycobacterium sp.]|nr:FAD-dependent oxidoreductase [Mycobacterium sp.]
MTAAKAVVVGSGPNGLAAAITLAREGVDVTVLEASDVIGGGLSSGERTLPGLLHDDCAAIVPTALASPFMQSLDLASHGVEWAWPEVELAHPVDGGRAGVLTRSIDDTALGMGVDGPAWRRLFEPLARDFPELAPDVFGPLLGVPSHPLLMASFGAKALVPATALARRWRTDEVRALWAGNAAHAWTPLSRPPTSGIALMFGAVAHRYGWPTVKGGVARLADGLASILASVGGSIETGQRATSRKDLPAADIVMFDLAPGAVADILGDALPSRIQRAYRRFRYGAGAYKVDFAVAGGVPWLNESCRAAGTVHVCGSFEEVVAAERATSRGHMPERPFVIVAQQYLMDPGRSAGGVHPLYTYAHVPHGFSGDATDAIIDQIERFAPGFRDRIVGIDVRTPRGLQEHDANLIGGDVNGGSMDLRQFIARPRLTTDPYWTGVPGHFLCSASTPPGAGLHGMCGHLAAKSALRHGFRHQP